MPPQATDDEDDTLELTPDVEADDQDQGDLDDDDSADRKDDESGRSAREDGDDEGGEEETIVSFGDEEQAVEEDESSVLRKLRDRNKELNQELTKLRKATPAPKIDVGEKPTLESCGYDADEFETELDAWKARKSAAEAEQTKAEEQDRIVQAAWQEDVSSYLSKKVSLGVPDYDEAEDTIKATLDQVQQAVIVKAANDPAAFIYALAGSEAKLAELAKIMDPIKMAAAVARMEGAIKVVKRRKAPDPEKIERGSASTTPVRADAVLEKLEKDAAKNGNDRTKVIAFKKAAAAKTK